MKPLLNLNPITKFWQNLTSSQCFVMKIFEYFKVVDIAIVQMIGLVEDERCFSTFAFMKSKLRNRFNDHLDLVVCMFTRKL